MNFACRDLTVADSPLARWDARWKLAAMILFTAGVASVQRPLPLAVALGLALHVTLLARLPVRRVAKRIAFLLLATLPFVAVLPFAVDRGWEQAFLIAMRCVAIGLIGFALANSAPLPRTFAAARALGVPGAFVLVAQLAYRYVFVLFAEARRLRVVLMARAFRPRTNAHTYRTVGHVAGALLVHGGDRAERVAAAMRCRGFDGTLRSAPFHTTPWDVLSFLVVVGGTIAVVIWDRTP